MKKLVLSGFQPFFENLVNPTELLVKELDQTEVGNYLIKGQVLPVEYQRSFEVLNIKVKREDPDSILMLGLSSGRKEISLEKMALNMAHCSREDNAGCLSLHKTIYSDGDLALQVKRDLITLATSIEGQGIPCKVSYNAGTFVCNSLYYKMLSWKQETGFKGEVLFVHVPNEDDLSIMKVLHAIRHLIEQL